MRAPGFICRRAFPVEGGVQSKRGPSIFQPYWDLWKLSHKDEVVSDETTWIFRVTPYLVFVMPILVTILIPVLTDHPLVFAFMGDMLAGGFLLGLHSLRLSELSPQLCLEKVFAA